MGKIRLTLACWDYDRTRALQEGRVEVEGVELTYLPLRVEETFWRMLRYGEFDAAELSTGSYLMARDKGSPKLIAIPVFPSKTFRHSCIYINTDSGIEKPADMAGKRVGVPEYQITMAIWARGILQHEYGVPPEKMKWFTGGEEHPGREDKIRHDLPPAIDIRPIGPHQTLSSMLERGEIDAMISAHMPSPFVRRSPKVRRLIPNFREVEADYFRRTKIFPIMHTVVIRNEILERNPWAAVSVLQGFQKAKELCYRRMQNPRNFALVWMHEFMQEQEEIFSKDPWPYNLEDNRKALEAVVRYAHDEGMIKTQPKIEELFYPSSLQEKNEYLS